MSHKPYYLIAIAAVLVMCALVVFPANTAATFNIAAMLKPSIAVALAIPAAIAEPLAFSIKQFCKAHGISTATYYEIKKAGLGPAEMRMGTLVRISAESAAAWRRARENPSKAEAEESARTAKAMQERARNAAKRAVASPLHVSRRAANVA